MDETFNINAIIINRKDFREHDTRLAVFSFEAGKMDLVVRGAKKISSKISPFVEPISYSKIMVVRGKMYDYVGGADIIKSYNLIKSDLQKSLAAGKMLQLYNKFTRDKLKDENLYILLSDALNIVEDASADLNFLFDIFVLKFFRELGYAFELYNCVICGKKLVQSENTLDFSKGGIVCRLCREEKRSKNPVLTISSESIIILRLINEQNIKKLTKIIVKPANKNEIKAISGSLIKFYSN
jgi:DNA repair protein RecO (recombination protein O)